MKEYRIVGTVTMEHGDGRKWTLQTAGVWTNGGNILHYNGTSIEEAEQMLLKYKEDAKKFDELTARRFIVGSDYIKYTQTNIRIQEREVTEWEDWKQE